MTNQPYTEEREAARHAVMSACRLTRKVASTVHGIAKADTTPVTVADFAAQALMIRILRRRFPNDTFVGEEDAAVLREDPELCERVCNLVRGQEQGQKETAFNAAHGQAAQAHPASKDDILDAIDLGGRGVAGRAGRFWVMDPIDGTATFLSGQQYAVALALIEDGREVVGVLGCPNLRLKDGRVHERSVEDEHGLGFLLEAVRGGGSTASTMTLDGITSSSVIEAPLPLPADLSKAHFVDSLLSKSSRHDLVARVADALGATFPGTDVWSSHIRYAALILGGGDVHLRIPSKPGAKSYIWDHAGAQLIFTEAGGKVTDLDGKPVDFGAGRTLSANRGLLAARAGLHERVLKLASEVVEENKNAP